MTTLSPDHLDFVRTFDVQPVLANPILDIAARFWEEERYDAFKLCYQSMRVMDDLIDDRKTIDPEISEVEKRELATTVNDWAEAMSRGTPSDAVPDQLAEAIAQFQIPLWPWQRFSESMLYDLSHDGFATYRDFLSYTEGAAVAPGAVFMHLCGIVKTNGGYHLPRFDIREAARPLARFCYLVHIW